MDCKTLTPEVKSQSLATIRVKFPSNGEGNTHTRKAVRMNHRKEAEVAIKVLFFFSFFIIKTKKRLFGRSPNAMEYNWHHLRYPNVKSWNV